jgi:coenzyme F420-0:L-glutamate ligase / coenzyme F420-1:gamma-L-glutamate ligase
MARVDPVELFALPGIPDVQKGNDLGELIVAAIKRLGEALREGDVLVVAHKIISKSEGRSIKLSDMTPGTLAREIASAVGKDSRKVQAILEESDEIVRVARTAAAGVIIARHRHGWVSANSGVDESNVGQTNALLLLPLDPDESARKLADAIEERCDVRPGIVVTDTFGRAWRRGYVAIGLCGVSAIVDLSGTEDAFGRRLEVAQQALADEIAAASGLLMLKSARLPVVLARGVDWRPAQTVSAKDYVRPVQEDFFR